MRRGYPVSGKRPSITPLDQASRLRIEFQLATVRGGIASVGFLAALAGRIESPLHLLLSLSQGSLPSVQVRLACR